MDGNICCICNHKGGVGKTSVACNLGAALSLQKKKVLVIDNDPQANATGILLPASTIIRNSVYELLDPNSDQNDAPIENFVYPTGHKGLYCLPNVEETSGLEMELVERYPESLKYLRNKIRDYSKRHFDYTIIDCSPTLSLFVANALHSSDFAIVPVDAGSAYSLDGLRKMLELIDSIQHSSNPDLRFLRMLINRIDRRTSISRIIIDDLKDRFGDNLIFSTMIPLNTPFQQAEYIKATIFSHSPTSRGSKAYRELARELIGVIER